MVNKIKTIYFSGLNKGYVVSLKFYVVSLVWKETPEEGWRMHWPKHCKYNNKENSSNTLNDK